jgi:hypothetical protein
MSSARRLAVTARRAVEARFVVDLSEMNDSEAFVQAPAVWADEIYVPAFTLIIGAAQRLAN